jgi:hypothetical protein
LRIIGKRGKSRLFYVVAAITSPFLQKSLAQKYIIVRFVVDTGATITCIGMKDALKNNINILTFEKIEDPILGIGGNMDTFRLQNCQMFFQTNIGDNNYHTEPIEEIRFFYEPNLYNKNYRPLPSLLGIDILQRFKISFNEDYVFLEK